MKERLVELLKEAPLCYRRFDLQYSDGTIEKIADYLLENDVIVPPVRIGQTVYQICFGKLSEQKIIKKSKVTAIKITDKLTITLDYTTNLYDTDIGYWVFLTREEAEAKLKEGGKE